MPPHLLPEAGGLGELPELCRINQRPIRNRAPQKERQPRRQIGVVDPIARARVTVAGISSTLNRKCRLDSIACSAVRMPPSKPPAVLAREPML